MTTLTGIALAPGVVRGAAMTIQPTSVESRARADDRRTPHEQLREAWRGAEAELRRTLDALPATEGPARQIARAHLALLADPVLVADIESRITQDATNVVGAVERSAAALAARFEALADPVMRQRAADVRDVCDYIRDHLTGGGASGRASGEPRIVCAPDLSPAQVLRLAQGSPLAFVLEHGAETSHAAILMRALGVPAVIGVRGATRLVQDGDLLLVDGNRGHVFVGQGPDVSFTPNVPIAVATCESDPQCAATRDGAAVAVTATIADAAEARRAMAAGADGIGLFRTEMLFLSGELLPSEHVQETFYREVGRAIGSASPLTVRLLDLGGDKQVPALGLIPETNPALGPRGVRLLLARPELCLPHLRAVLRAFEGRRVRLLVPMVIDVTDVIRIREMIDTASRAIESNLPPIDLGVMVETPAAALMAEELAAAADFMSIGTNDLIQYVLAADRESERMAAFYQPLHPAVLRLVRSVMMRAAQHGKPVSVCGETAADPRVVPLLVGLGVTELSVRPSAIARVKSQVRRIARAAAQALAEDAVALPTATAIAARIDRATEEEIGIDVHEECYPR